VATELSELKLGQWAVNALNEAGLDSIEKAALKDAEDPAFLLTLKGVTAKTVEKIRTWWAEHGPVNDYEENLLIENWGTGPVEMAYSIMLTLVQENKKAHKEYANQAWALVREFLNEVEIGI
jgi:hypothetical protein